MRFDKLFAGMVGARPSYLRDGDVAGIEPVLETIDADYEGPLARAFSLVETPNSGKVWRPHGESSNVGPGPRCVASPGGIAAEGPLWSVGFRREIRRAA
jgi:hypothetical protein